jgi:hypothetical protein
MEPLMSADGIGAYLNPALMSKLNRLALENTLPRWH